MPDNPFFEKARTMAEADFPVEQNDLAEPVDSATEADDAEGPSAESSGDAPEPSEPAAGGGAD